jgi:hypothetical protein
MLGMMVDLGVGNVAQTGTLICYCKGTTLDTTAFLGPLILLTVPLYFL